MTPIERRRIVISKLAVAATITMALVFPATLLAGLIVGGGRGGESIAVGFAVAVLPGALVYTAGFLALSVVTTRALIAGLLYVFIWEGLFAGLFPATALLSVRQYVLAVAGWVAGADGRAITSSVEGLSGVVLALVVLGVAVAIAIRRLGSWEVRTAD